MKILRNILKGISFTGALFVFHACYGEPYDPLLREGGMAPMSFTLVSHVDGKPIEGVKISASAWKTDDGKQVIGTTGADGKCTVEIPYLRNNEGPYIRFEDPDKVFAVKDTTLADLRERDITVKMDPKL
ncbi:MAG: hypothetical protein J6Y66_07350 [Bacteroidales bacterium]|nr:hypothetical protein [Bacteroidales bacterium]